MLDRLADDLLDREAEDAHGHEDRDQLTSTIAEEVQPVAHAVVATAITEADIPGQVTTAVGTAITDADIPALVDAAVGPAVTAEVGEQAPPLVTAEVALRVPPAVDAAITTADVPGQVAIALAAQAGKIIQGTGMPNGVVTASPGTIYVDTASTMGASVWRKVTGTGTSGWVVSDGTTGLRELLAISTPSASGFIRVNRYPNIITLSLADVVLATGHTGTVDLVTLPTGFRPDARANVNNTNAPNNRIYVDVSGTVRLYAAVAAQTVNASVTFGARDSWPTSLPGTPV